MWSSKPNPGYVSRENHNSKNTCISMLDVHHSTITTAKTWKQTKCLSMEGCIKKMGCVTQRNLTQPQEAWNNAFCGSMQGPRGYHAKYRESERERQMAWYPLYEESKVWQKWTYIGNRDTHMHRKQTRGHQRGWGGGRVTGSSRFTDTHRHT